MWGAKSPISGSDYEALVLVLEQPGNWNRFLTPVVKQLLDDNVTTNTWLETYQRALPKLRGCVSTMKVAALGIRDSHVRSFVGSITSVYSEQLDELVVLSSVVRSGDIDGQSLHRKALAGLGAKKNALIRPALDRMIDLGLGSQLNAVLAEKAKKLAKAWVHDGREFGVVCRCVSGRIERDWFSHRTFRTETRST